MPTDLTNQFYCKLLKLRDKDSSSFVFFCWQKAVAVTRRRSILNGREQRLDQKPPCSGASNQPMKKLKSSDLKYWLIFEIDHLPNSSIKCYLLNLESLCRHQQSFAVPVSRRSASENILEFLYMLDDILLCIIKEWDMLYIIPDAKKGVFFALRTADECCGGHHLYIRHLIPISDKPFMEHIFVKVIIKISYC